MKILKLLAIAFTVCAFTSCGNDEENEPQTDIEKEKEEVAVDINYFPGKWMEVSRYVLTSEVGEGEDIFEYFSGRNPASTGSNGYYKYIEVSEREAENEYNLSDVELDGKLNGSDILTITDSKMYNESGDLLGTITTCNKNGGLVITWETVAGPYNRYSPYRVSSSYMRKTWGK